MLTQQLQTPPLVGYKKSCAVRSSIFSVISSRILRTWNGMREAQGQHIKIHLDYIVISSWLYNRKKKEIWDNYTSTNETSFQGSVAPFGRCSLSRFLSFASQVNMF